MAAKKSGAKKASSSKKADATKTPAKASKASKQEHRRPAPTVGDTAGAEFNPARTEEGERVAQTGANPAASRAGQLVSFGVLSANDNRPEIALGSVDGGNVTLTVGKQEVALTKDDIITFRQHLDAAFQS